MPEEFKHLNPEVCGPHCYAKDNGSGHWVAVQHCKKCHAEKDFHITQRPNH